MSVFNNKLSIKSIMTGAAASVIILALLLFVFSGILLFIPKTPYEALSYIMLAAYAVAALIGAYIAAAISGSNGLITGLCSSAVLFIILLIIGFASGSGSVSILTVFKLISILIPGAIGGIKGVNRKERIHIR